MDTIEQKARAMTPPVTPKVAPLPAPYRKEFSLTSGARYLGIGKGTLRAAIDKGEVAATKNAKGHYVIEGAEIFQYEQNLDADETKPVLAPASTRANTRVSTSSGTGAKGGADTPSSTGDDTPSDRRIGTVSKDMHQTVVEGLEARLLDRDGTIRDLKDSVESWQTQAKSWQNHADNNLRLLTDERAKSEQLQPDINLAATGQGSHVWRNTIAAAALAALVVSAFYYRADLAQQWAKITASDASKSATNHLETPQG